MLKTCALTALIAFAAVGSATSADLAANLPAKAPYISAYNWTGCYIGVHGGGGASQNGWSNAIFAPLVGGGGDIGSVRATGWLAGGQAGCDYQTGNLVFGIEGQFSAADLHGQTTASIPTAPASLSSPIDRLATGTARIGYAFDRALPYIKGGLAWAHNGKNEMDAFDPALGGSVPLFVGNGGNVFGWTAGAGIEVAFHPNWSWKVEYNYIDLGANGSNLACVLATACTGSSTLASGLFDIKQSIQTVVIGINYRFQ